MYIVQRGSSDNTARLTSSTMRMLCSAEECGTPRRLRARRCEPPSTCFVQNCIRSALPLLVLLLLRELVPDYIPFVRVCDFSDFLVSQHMRTRVS